MRHIKPLMLTLLIASAFSGCKTTETKASSPIIGSVTTTAAQSLETGESRMGVMPQARMGYVMEEPLPYRLPEKVRVVEVAGYKNERGEVILPTRKLVVDEPSRWNMEAVRNPHRAYVEPEHLKAMPASSAINYNLADSADVGSPPEAIPVRDLTTIDNIDFTGLFRLDQEEAAMAMASPNQQAVHDDDLGWILIPSTQTVPDVLFNQQ